MGNGIVMSRKKWWPSVLVLPRSSTLPYSPAPSGVSIHHMHTQRDGGNRLCECKRLLLLLLLFGARREEFTQVLEVSTELTTLTRACSIGSRHWRRWRSHTCGVRGRRSSSATGRSRSRRRFGCQGWRHCRLGAHGNVGGNVLEIKLVAARGLFRARQVVSHQVLL